MKVKLLRRVFCVVMCIAILACSSVNAFGAELYEESDVPDGTVYYWEHYTSDTLSMLWVEVNIPTSFAGGINRGNLIGGINSWVLGTSAYTPRVVMTEFGYSYENWPETGWVQHSIPSSSFWNGLFEWPEQVENTLAQTVIFSDGIEIEQGKPQCNNISYGLIYYNFNHNNMAGFNWTNTVAHEIGHTLGFGHHSGDSTIMDEDNTNITALQDYDKEEYVAKYGSNS